MSPSTYYVMHLVWYKRQSLCTSGCHVTAHIATCIALPRVGRFCFLLSLGFLKGRSLCAVLVHVKDGLPPRSSPGGESPCFLSDGYGFGSTHLHSCFHPAGMKGNRCTRRLAEVGRTSSGQGVYNTNAFTCVYKPCSPDIVTWGSPQLNDLFQRPAGVPSS